MLDTISLEVISESIERPIISRDTIEVLTGPLWQSFDSKNPTKVLVGLDPAYLEGTTLQVRLNVTDDLDTNSVGLLLSFYVLADGNIGGVFTQGDLVNIPLEATSIVTDIPIFNALGQITGYSPGIEISNLLTKHFQIGDNFNLTRTFNLTIISSNGSEVSGDFSFTFVPQDELDRRVCWLESYFECKDYFQN